MSSSKRALITGATGYVGSKLCARLLSDGWQVGVVVRTGGRALREPLAGRVDEVLYDGTTESLVDGVAAFKPEIVFHLASLFIAEHRSDQVTDLVTSNVLFGSQLLEGCAHAGVKHFINTGTSWQHYRTAAYDPVCLYAATKQAFEDVIDYYVDAFQMRAITLKLFDTYGADDPRPKLVNLLLKAARDGQRMGMSPGEQGLDLVHIDDVTNAFISCAGLLADASQAVHQRYVVSSGHVLSLRELVGVIQEIAGPMEIAFGERPYRRREVMTPISSAPVPPGWQATIDLKAGLAAIYQAHPR
jgi:nucleoside-diphosphate-sugar epimerase